MTTYFSDIEKKDGFYIYGTGSGALRFFHKMSIEYPKAVFLGFIDSFKEGRLLDYHVYAFESFKKGKSRDSFICIASIAHSQISSLLEKDGFINYMIVPPSFQNYISQKHSSYLKWLGFVNSGMMAEGNYFCFDYAIRNLPSSTPIIEIGSFCGLSTNIISYYKKKYNKKSLLITCDEWRFEGGTDLDSCLPESNITFAQYRSFAKEAYIRNISFFSRSDKPYTVEISSDQFFDMWENKKRIMDVLGRSIQLGGDISFCFIDGNHSYQYARRDFENADTYLQSGGFVLFDDSADRSEWEVCKVVEEVKKRNDYEIVINNPNYLFRKK